jgi:agmatine deiminase
VHLAAVNRVGVETPVEFWGGSFVSDAFGRVVAEGSSDREEIVLANLDLSQNETLQQGWGFMRNRRPDTYQLLAHPVRRPDPFPAPARPSAWVADYRMPAEWEPHHATWLAWPHDRETFPRRVAAVEAAYVRIVHALHVGELVHLVVKDPATRRRATLLLSLQGVDMDRVRFHVWPYADVWFRDYGPTFVLDSQDRKAMVHWQFNAWGGKYPELMADATIPVLMNVDLKLPRLEPGLFMEGGAIDVNGAGTLLTTEQCLLNGNRNPGLDRINIERCLEAHLGVRNILWLPGGIVGDDTDGHIDNLARFVNPTTVVCLVEPDETDENYSALRRNREFLSGQVDQDGRPLDIIQLPAPGRIRRQVRGERRRLPASYANFYIGNQTVLVPTFNCPQDDPALRILGEVFSGRTVTGIDCSDLLLGLGTLHCITQQEPAAVPHLD